MAEPTSPAADTPGGGPVDGSAAATSAEPELLSPPTEDELAATGEPTADEIHAAAGGDAASAPPEAPAAPVEAAPAAPPPPPPAAPAAPPVPAAPAAPAAPQPVLVAADDVAPPLPRARGNRLVGTAWALLGAGLFQVVFFGINALVALTFGGPAAAAPQVKQIAGTSLAWLPVVLFFLFFELTVLLLNRAGRVAYVLASLIVGAIVYVLTALLFTVIERHTFGDANTLAQTFLNWDFILIGLAAREVMLWTGLAIGSRGIRVRRRNREDRARYDEGVADA